MIGPTLFTQTFAFFIRPDSALRPQPSAFESQHGRGVSRCPFILASLMLLSAAMIAWRTTKTKR